MKINSIKRVLPGVLMLLFFFPYLDAVGQNSSFQYAQIDKKRDIGKLSYNGSLISIADTDTATIDGFSYLSIGRIKQIGAISNGCIYIMVEYTKGQLILFVSLPPSETRPLDQQENWISSDLEEINSCLAEEDQISLRDNRNTLYKTAGYMTIFLVNVLDQ